MQDKKFEIKTYTKQELCIFYGIRRPILKNWFKQILKKIPDFEPAFNRKNYLTPNEVKILVEHVGEP